MPTAPPTELRLRYCTIEFDGALDIHLRMLRDRQEFEDPEGTAADIGISSAEWAYFGVVWDSSRALAELMRTYEVEGLRVLEVGCGLALSSLMLNQRGADVTATDVHPEAGAFLRANVALNGAKSIPFVRGAWADADPELGRFDLIIGSDVLYHDEHALSLVGFIEQHAAPVCEVVIIDPGRSVIRTFKKNMQERFEHSQEPVAVAPGMAEGYHGTVHTFRSRVTFA